MFHFKWIMRRNVPPLSVIARIAHRNCSVRICCCQNSSQVLPSSCGKQGDELRFQGTVLWSSSVLAGVRFCLKTELLLFPGAMSNTQERAGVWCGAHDTGHCFSHYPSCQSFGGLCFKKFNKAFSSEVWIKLIFSEGLVRHRLTHTYCGFAQFHTHRNNYWGGNRLDDLLRDTAGSVLSLARLRNLCSDPPHWSSHLRALKPWGYCHLINQIVLGAHLIQL